MTTATAPPAPDRAGHPGTAGPRFARQPALDGLRALAVAAVVAYHLGYPWMRGGFLGVDAFFVLSGYLITSLLLHERRRSGGNGLGGFWNRRARRLLPAVFVMIGVVTAYAATVVPAYRLGTLRGDALAGVFYVANWHQILADQSYFAVTAAPSPFQHLWSLAIEEQFYLVWPLLFVGVAASSRRVHRALLATAAVGVLGAQVTMTVLYREGDPSRAYYATPARLNGLLIGAALAVILFARPALARRVPRGASTAGAVFAVAGLILAWSRVEPTRWFFLGGDTLVCLLVAALLFLLQTDTPVRRALGIGPLVWIGGISYAIYLWHWPVIQYADAGRLHLDGNALRVAQVAITVVIAAGSTFLLERRVLRTRVAAWRWAVPATAVVVAVVLVATAGATAAPRFLNRRAGVHPCTGATESELRPARAVLEHRPVGPLPAVRGRRIGVLGDSRACSLLTGLEAAAPGVGVEMLNGAVLGCGVVAGATILDGGIVSREWAHACPPAARRALERVRDADVLVVWSAWEAQDLEVDGQRVVAGTPEHDLVVGRRLDRWLAEEVPAGVPVVLLLTPRPTTDADGEADDPDAARRMPHLNEVYQAFAAAHPDRVHLLDLDRRICGPPPTCPAKLDGVTLRPDGQHLGPESSALVTRWLLPRLDTILADGSR